MWKFFIFSLIAAFCAIWGYSSLAHEDTEAQFSEVQFPKTVSFSENDKEYLLEMTGASIRKKFFVTVYHVAHYMEPIKERHGWDKFQEVMRDNKAKQLTLKWVRDLVSEKVQEGYRQSFKHALEGRKDDVQEEVNRYIQFFSRDVKKDDQHILRWTAGGKVEVIINEEEPKIIDNKEFAKVLWSIWFGNKTVVNRNQLVSLMN